MKLEDRMQQAVNRRSSNVILRSDVAKMGSASQVSVGLARLQKKGTLIRLGKGVFAKAVTEPVTGAVLPVQDLKTLASEALRRLGIDGKIESIGPDAVFMVNPNSRIKRKLSVGDKSVSYVRGRSRLPKLEQVAPTSPSAGGSRKIPKVGLDRYVRNLARRYRVDYAKTYADEWAEHVTRLAGDEVHTDHIENLVIALKKARKISGAEMVQMLANYLREKRV